MGEILKKQGATFEYGTARLEDRAAILADIERVRMGWVRTLGVLLWWLGCCASGRKSAADGG